MKLKSIFSSLVAAFVSCAALGLVSIDVAYAEAPMVKTQAPGYYRMMLGDFEVTALFDGTADLPLDELLKHTSVGKLNNALSKSFLNLPVETPVNAYLINTGKKLILIDAGSLGYIAPTLGKLVDNLKASGYQPEQIDEIYLTHMHPDHVGGLINGGQMVFPNAVVRASRSEAEFWLSQANADKASGHAKVFFKAAMTSVNPYVDAKHFSPFEGNTELSPGISTVSAAGHTHGHSMYVVESKGQKLVIWGDVVHAAAIQFADPDVTIEFDTDSKSAAALRKKVFAEAAKGRYLIAAPHIAFPGLGHVARQGKAYVWVPINYGILR